ncbi:hypothetical protein COHA_007486 [Chlorella ohadii]|uniref:F-box domain-containing protein n=1 Tax=Chlorella ohadii TaxID=2649997 RepID=A0AAD5GZT3_9CHLO|nr:hypothetical protein COHA_007486 [Chlorella ohadii]
MYCEMLQPGDVPPEARPGPSAGPKAEPVDFVQRWPSHLSQKVLSCLHDHRDLAAAALVCRRWHAVVQEERVWQACYAARFPAPPTERCWEPAAQAAADALSWPERYRWRLGLDQAWRSPGRRRLVHALEGHHAWVNAVKLVPGVGVASGGSEGQVNLWSTSGDLLLHNAAHNQAVWALDATADRIATGGMDGWVHLLDTGSGALLHRLPVGWRGPADQLPDPEDWQGMNIVTSVQLLPGGSGLVLAGCMDGHIQLLDPRCRQPAVLQLSWSGHRQHARAQLQQRFWRAGEPSRLCAARCQEHLLVAGGDAAAVSLHDLRMVAKHSSSSGGGGCNGVSSGNGGSGAGGSSGVDSSNGAGSGSGPAGPRNGCFAELVLPAAFGQRMPSVFAMDLLYPRLAVGGDRGQVLVWDLSRLAAPPAVLPPAPEAARPLQPRLLYSLWGSSSSSGHGQQRGEELLQAVQLQGAAVAAEAAANHAGAEMAAAPAGIGPPAGWPSPDPAARSHGRSQSASTAACSPAACSVDCLLATNEHLLPGLQMGCVYGLKLLPDWRLLTADHSGCVRLWNCRDLVGAARPTLTLQGAFAPSRDSPAAALVDEQGGPPRPVGMHSVDACLTHLAVAGRDSVVRLYAFE